MDEKQNPQVASYQTSHTIFLSVLTLVQLSSGNCYSAVSANPTDDSWQQEREGFALGFRR
jgi:hypothetical protein